MQTFKLTELARMIKAARLGGLTVRRVTTDGDGRPVLITDAGEASSVPPPSNPWEKDADDAA